MTELIAKLSPAGRHIVEIGGEVLDVTEFARKKSKTFVFRGEEYGLKVEESA